MSTPLVSIIIPCFNSAPWLRDTIESALAQTYPATEIVVIDDGSTDASAAIAREYAARGVRVLTQVNAGASAARNHGLRETRGELIQFLDADDLLSPGKIAAQVALLQTRPPGTVASCAWGRFETDPAEARFVDTAVFRDFLPLDFLLLAAATGAMMQPNVWLAPRPVIDRAGPWNESLSLNDDGEFFCRVLLAGAGIAFAPGETARVFYRSAVGGSLSRQRSRRARDSQFRSLELCDRHLLEAEDSPRVRGALARQWQRFVHDFFPAPAELMARAEARARALGAGPLGAPPMGPKTAALARVIGWRNTWRLKHLLRR